MNATHPLGNLIQAAQDKNGWSTRDLQRRAERLGFDMKHSNFSRLKNQELVSIKGSVIHALADVLQVSIQRVAQAAMASMGVEVSADPPALDDVVRDSQEFSSRDRKIIQGLVETIRTLDATTDKEVVGNAQHPAPNTRAGESPAPKFFLANETVSNVNDARSKRAAKKPYVDEHAHPDADASGNVPLPSHWDQLAADSSRNYGAEEETRAGERGEETQENDQDN